MQAGLIHQVGKLVSSYAPAHRYAVVTDANVHQFYAGAVEASFAPHTIDGVKISAGETHKTRETWGIVTDALLDAGLGRDSTIVALGGGVVGDLAGFVAATYMRGVPFVQVPTTLVAMVDAAIGGKTGVDTLAGKNLVGCFHMPAAVLIDPQVLVTLPLRELRAGFAEVIKCGVVADTAYFELVRQAMPELLSGAIGSSDRLEPLLVRGIGIKVSIVVKDERESGLRKVLNFGHTIGHAVEKTTGYSLLHGEAVAIGMAVESRLAERIGAAEPGTAARIEDALNIAGLPARIPPQCSPQQLLDAMRSDKKGREGKIRFALPTKVGEMAKDGDDWSVPVADQLIMEVLL
ncbi:MAG: 3-dehydroquinate synthase [Gemmatimonadaceae bacterium]|nr:3-dehydroquinate synthase [Gemmatimonadaceae bacterium]